MFNPKITIDIVILFFRPPPPPRHEGTQYLLYTIQALV
jgi:hypothetical protein